MCNYIRRNRPFHFLGLTLPKMDLGLEIQKTNVGIRISILEIPCVPIFSKTDSFEFFGLNLEKLSNYVQNFGSNNVEGIAES